MVVNFQFHQMYSTLLDSEIAKFFDTSNDGQLEDVHKYFCAKNNTFNWEEIGSLLRTEPTSEDITNLKYKQILIVVHRLQHIYVACESVTQKIEDFSKFQWLGNNLEVLRPMFVSTDVSGPTTTVEQLLLLTSMLEFALGNVYYSVTDGKQPPHLLRDLLCTAEMKRIFGWEAISFLKILLGTPNGINLRNIVWHGFPQPDEIPRYFVSVLLVAMHTLGHALEVQQLQLQQRAQLTDLSRYFAKFEESKSCNNFTAIDLEAALKSCKWLSVKHKLYWEQLLIYYNSANYWQYVVLVLPQIELLLRLHYARANDFDVRAKLDEYYITMDSVFDVTVPGPDNRSNQLLPPASQGLSVVCLKFMYDLFVAPQGPRIRDKVSHGEVTLQCLDNAQLCQQLLQLSVLLLTQQQPLKTTWHYESRFHLNCMASNCISNAKNSLLSLANLNSTTKIEINREQQQFISSASHSIEIAIFQRPKKEPELMLLLLKISQLIAQTCANYCAAVCERLVLLQQHELRAKRRKTLEQMLNALPEIWQTLYAVIFCMAHIFNSSQMDFEEKLAPSLDNILKFLKQTLKVAENFVKYSDKESNEWIKALALCQRFKESHQRNFHL